MAAEVQTGHQNREGDLKVTLRVARLLMPDGLISQTADLLRFSQIWKKKKKKISSYVQFFEQKRPGDARGQRKTVRLLQADKKTTVTQITSSYNQGMQERISQLTKCLM